MQQESSHSADVSAEAEKEFLAVLMRAQQGLFAYILSQVTRVSDADDILQETNMVLWQKRADFTPGTNFWAWAARVAHFQVLAYAKRRSRDRLMFDEGLVTLLAAESSPAAQQMGLRQEALQTCLGKLDAASRQLVRMRYADALGAEEIASRLKRTKGAVYNALYRVRTALGRCIERQLLAEERGL